MRGAGIAMVALAAVLAFAFFVPIQPTNWQPGGEACASSGGQITNLCSSVATHGYVSLTCFISGAGAKYNTITNQYGFAY